MATSRQLREQIAAGRWDAALAALYGGSEEVLARQRSRYGAALEQFDLYYGPGRQVQVYSAPAFAKSQPTRALFERSELCRSVGGSAFCKKSVNGIRFSYLYLFLCFYEYSIHFRYTN